MDNLEQVYESAGQAVYVHACSQAGARAVTMAWGAGYPPVAAPVCDECGLAYEVFSANPGHVDPAAGLLTEREYVSKVAAQRAAAVKAADNPVGQAGTLEQRIEAATVALLAPEPAPAAEPPASD